MANEAERRKTPRPQHAAPLPQSGRRATWRPASRSSRPSAAPHPSLTRHKEALVHKLSRSGALLQRSPWHKAEARAAELEASAGRLRAVGLAEQADELEKQASEQRKLAEKAPEPGKRIDMLKAWIKRAEGRVAKSSDRIADAQKELKDAQAAHKALQDELEDGRGQLQMLRNNMRSSDDAEDAAEPAAKRAAPAPSAAMEELHQQLQQAKAEAERLRSENVVMRKAGHSLETELAAVKAEQTAMWKAGHSLETELTAVKAEQTAAEQAHIQLRGLGSAELKKRLAQCFADLQAALNSSKWQEAEALEDTTKKLTAALREAGERESQAGSAFNPDGP